MALAPLAVRRALVNRLPLVTPLAFYKTRGQPSSTSSFSSSPITSPSVSASSHRTFTTTRPNPFAATAADMAEKLSLFEAAESRRSIYTLTDKLPISDARVQELVTHAIKHTPSAFNSQSTRLVVLLNDEHRRFWDFVAEVLKPNVPEANWGATEAKLGGFKAGHGTILFFEDPAPIKKLQSAFPLYADHFPQWSEQTNAMHQYFLWTALEAEGAGANLQHYNPVVDQKAKTYWGVNLEWSLKGQLVFGGIAEGGKEKLKEKAFQPVEDRVFVHGAK